MLSRPGLVLLLFLRAAPIICSRSSSSSGLQVNCSSLGLSRWPRLFPDTSDLDMRGNLLTGVPAGLFDPLVKLRRVSLSHNPFRCDCGIQYLRSWLLKNRALVSVQPTCSSPPDVANQKVMELPDDLFESCGSTDSPDWTFAAAMTVTLSGLVVLLLWVTRLSRRSTFNLQISCSDVERRPGRRHSERSEVSSDWTELELLPVNMDLLPQVLDVLHKKHNIKIKIT